MPASKEETLHKAKEVLAIEANAVAALQERIGDDFYNSVKCIYESNGRVVVTGIGKSAIIGQKLVATFNSTGTPSIFMHAADAVHGDLGMIQKDDVVLCISNSGSTPEIKVLLPWLKSSAMNLIAMTGNTESELAQSADYVLNASVAHEACPNNLAPTTTTTAQLALGDALAVCLLEWRNFSADDFARFHPGGALGKKLYVHVSDLYKQNEKPLVRTSDDLKTVILEITGKRLGATVVLDTDDKIAGIITDGDLRRLLSKTVEIANIKAQDIMNFTPSIVDENILAAEALQTMRTKKITQLIVTSGGSYAGILHIHDLNREGLIF